MIKMPIITVKKVADPEYKDMTLLQALTPLLGRRYVPAHLYQQEESADGIFRSWCRINIIERMESEMINCTGIEEFLNTFSFINNQGRLEIINQEVNIHLPNNYSNDLFYYVVVSIFSNSSIYKKYNTRKINVTCSFDI